VDDIGTKGNGSDIEGAGREPGSRRRARLVRWILLVAAIGAILVAFRLLDGHSTLRAAIEAIRDLGPIGPIVLVLVYVLACILALPGSILTLGAGFVFGLLEGYLYVTIGSVLGATAAFLVGRTLARERVRAKLASSPRFRAIDEAVARQGWKIVLLTRLSPLFPFNLQNYMYGITGVPLRQYVLASWIGMIPGTILYVYLGSAAESLAQAASGDIGQGRGKMVLFGAGLVATLAATIYVTRLARAALRTSVRIPEAGEEGGHHAGVPRG